MALPHPRDDVDLLEELMGMVSTDDNIYLVKDFFKAHPGLDLNDPANSPLFSAPDEEILQLLVEKGADINIQRGGGETPLHGLLLKEEKNGEDHVYKLELLLKKGANPNILDDGENAPLHYAQSGLETELLLRYGANPNIQDQQGNTPLHYAKSYKQAKSLLRYGANPLIENNRGQMPYQYIRKPIALKLVYDYTKKYMLLSKSKTGDRTRRRSGERREPLIQFSTHPYYDKMLWRMVSNYGTNKD